MHVTDIMIEKKGYIYSLENYKEYKTIIKLKKKNKENYTYTFKERERERPTDTERQTESQRYTRIILHIYVCVCVCVFTNSPPREKTWHNVNFKLSLRGLNSIFRFLDWLLHHG